MSIIRGLRLLSRQPSSSTRASIYGLTYRRYASGHDKPQDLAHHGDAQTESKLHPEKWLKVARNWPHEYHYPGNHTARSGPAPGADDPKFELGHSTEHPLGGDTPKEDFSSPFWTAFLGLGVIVVAVWRVNDYVTSNGAHEHPLHAKLKANIPSLDQLNESTKHWVSFRQREADDRLIRHAWQPNRVWTPRFDGMFDRASDWKIVPGSQIDTSDIKFKHTWQRDDDLFGPPYPKNAASS
ncbi:hypothetical protein SeMB42_g02764 [Synchytrium endobioticum]|uniref:Uncharacterized protein n=1 Tax=Synchytrium endobioticum TaxID=286115 RepID=A0A507CSV6_9FUNG|nr:hypothetical protein SeLEV6574_g05699 [Synchytrium endobioticum]TPX48992.1 hypothetical protein SeMB42_g02764 [Synchytrium endobioticum]